MKFSALSPGAAPGLRRLACGIGFGACAALAAQAQPTVAVQVHKNDGGIVVDVRAEVAAPVSVVWSVLTDYDHMSSILSDIKASVVKSRDGNHLQVAQTADTQVGFLHFSASSLREVDLVPMREIRSHLISGDFQSFDGTTRITEHDGQTTIVNHSEYVPKAWLPPMIGPSVIQSETTAQYRELLAEVLRRRGAVESSPETAKPAASGRL
ncbi:MAG: SRPBCC family protein [Burkholderiales bacterium]|nr:SRPBCC family protein [Burkholderiales bacterium]